MKKKIKNYFLLVSEVSMMYLQFDDVTKGWYFVWFMKLKIIV